MYPLVNWHTVGNQVCKITTISVAIFTSKVSSYQMVLSMYWPVLPGSIPGSLCLKLLRMENSSGATAGAKDCTAPPQTHKHWGKTYCKKKTNMCIQYLCIYFSISFVDTFKSIFMSILTLWAIYPVSLPNFEKFGPLEIQKHTQSTYAWVILTQLPNIATYFNDDLPFSSMTFASKLWHTTRGFSPGTPWAPVFLRGFPAGHV